MRQVGVVLGVALLARLVGQLTLGAYLHPEMFEYEDIARNILAGRGYTYVKDGAVYVASQSSPLYIYLTALIYLVTGHSQAAMLGLQAVLGAATAALVTWLAARTYSALAAWPAGLLVALDPGLVIYSAKLHSLTLDAFAFVCVVCATIALPMAPRLAHAALLGAMVGLAALTRSTALVLLPVLLVWLGLNRAASRASLGVLALVALVVVAPWTIRASVLLGQPVLASSESTEWLWRGNNPSATGSSFTADGRLMLEAAPPELRERIQSAGEAERIGIYRDASLRFAREQPAQAAALYARKLASFWWASDTTGQLYPAEWLVWYLIWSALLLATALLGAWHGLRRPDHSSAVLLIVLVLLVTAASQSLFYVEGRHRLAVEPLLLVLSAGGLTAPTRAVSKATNKTAYASGEGGRID